MRTWTAARRALAALLLLPGAACSDGDEGSAEELCAAITNGPALDSVFASFDPTETEQALAQLRAAESRLEELFGLAPEDLRSALTTEIDFLRALIEILETTPPDDPSSVVAEINALAGQRHAAEAAATELAAFERTECGTSTAGASSSAP